LNKPVDKEKWGMPAHMVNAYYHPLLNEIAFPAGIMQPPFFDVESEDAVNYGRIGMVIGHEFTHDLTTWVLNSQRMEVSPIGGQKKTERHLSSELHFWEKPLLVFAQWKEIASTLN